MILNKTHFQSVYVYVQSDARNVKLLMYSEFVPVTLTRMEPMEQQPSPPGENVDPAAAGAAAGGAGPLQPGIVSFPPCTETLSFPPTLPPVSSLLPVLTPTGRDSRSRALSTPSISPQPPSKRFKSTESESDRAAAAIMTTERAASSGPGAGVVATAAAPPPTPEILASQFQLRINADPGFAQLMATLWTQWQRLPAGLAPATTSVGSAAGAVPAELVASPATEDTPMEIPELPPLTITEVPSSASSVAPDEEAAGVERTDVVGSELEHLVATTASVASAGTAAADPSEPAAVLQPITQTVAPRTPATRAVAVQLHVVDKDDGEFATVNAAGAIVPTGPSRSVVYMTKKRQ